MPNTGKPSLDCHLCRARRVKCDLTKPACLRCNKYGAICPGYRGQLDSVFHNENPSSIQQKRRRRPQQALSPPTFSPDNTGGAAAALQAVRNVSPAASVQSFTSVDSSLDIDAGFAILPPATFDLQLSAPPHSRSITLILDQFVNIMRGQRAYDWLDFLPSVFQETPDNSCLARAADLFATAHRSQLLHDASNEMQLKRQYGRTLQSIKTALADPSKTLEDTTLIAVWLLGHYEIMVGSPQSGRKPAPAAWHIHLVGLTTMLRLRGPGQFTTLRGRAIFWITFANIQIQCIISNSELPAGARGWLEIVRRDLRPAERLNYAASSYNLEACELVSKIVPLVMARNVEAACLASSEILERVAALDEMVLEPERPGDAYSPAELHIWNLNRSTRLKTHHWAVLLINFIVNVQFPFVQGLCDLTALRQQRRGLVHSIRDVADQILATIPNAFTTPAAGGSPSASYRSNSPSWSDGMRMLWPLALVARLTTLLPRHRRAAAEQLGRIGREMGIREALKQYPPPMDFPFEAEWFKEEDV